MALPFEYPPLMPDEAFQSFVARIARHYHTDCVGFCSDIGLPLVDMVNGREPAVAHIARITGLDASRLAHQAFRRVDTNVLSYKGQTFQRPGLRRWELHGCPACLRGDIAGSALPPPVSAYLRGHWLVRAIRTCPIHDKALIPLSLDYGTRAQYGPYDSVVRLTPVLDELDVLERGVARRTCSDLENYVHGRIEGFGSGPAFLDPLSLHSATRTCEVLGAVALFGREIKTRSLDEDDWRVAGAAGFDIVSSGPGSVSSFFNLLQDTYELNASRNGRFRAVFGALYKWAKESPNDPARAPLRDLLREHIFETMPVEPGEAVLGVTIGERRVHSVATACFDGRFVSRRLHRELSAAGVLAENLEEQRHRTIATSAEKVDALVAALRAGLSKTEAAAYLGISPLQFQRLVDGGIICPIVPKVRTARTQSRFSERALDDLLDRLWRIVPSSEVMPPGMADVASAAQAINTKMAHVLELVLNGKLPGARRSPSLLGLSSILVATKELGEVLRAEDKPLLLLSAVAKRLQVNKRTPAALVSCGFLKVQSVTSTKTHKTSRFLTAASVADFTTRMASLVELSGTYGIHNVKLFRMLTDVGLSPCIPNGRVLANFYDRAEVEAALPVAKFRTAEPPEV